jgi:outer membrane protein assembly factor BamB
MKHAASLVLAIVLAQAEWPQWRGPKRDGVSTDTGLLKQWPKEGPPRVWEAKGAGRGYSSLALTGGRIYTIGDGPSTASDKDEYLLCFDQATGRQLWKAKLGQAWNSGQEDWQSSRSTPTVDGELLYALTAHGSLICLETAAGKERWRKSLQRDFNGSKGDSWGYSESPLVDGNMLVCTPGGDKSTLVCLNKKTGAKVWSTVVPNDRGAGHASIVITEIGKVRVYVTTTAGGAIGVRATDGKFLWSYPIDKTTAVIPTPIIKGDLVFFSVGYGRGGALLRQVPTAEGGVKMEAVYDLNKELTNKHGGVVLVGDFLYGDTDSNGVPWCAELLTGKQRWKQRGSGRGSAAITYADGHLYIRFDNGQMVLAKASPDGYQETGSFEIPHGRDRKSWSHPVVAAGKLFLREGDSLLCYDVKEK